MDILLQLGHIYYVISLLLLYHSFWDESFIYVPYNLKSIFSYIFLALILFIISYYISFSEIVINLSVNTLLLFVFLAIIYKKENVLQLIKNRKSNEY
jgi:hypothetical protein